MNSLRITVAKNSGLLLNEYNDDKNITTFLTAHLPSEAGIHYRSLMAGTG